MLPLVGWLVSLKLYVNKRRKKNTQKLLQAEHQTIQMELSKQNKTKQTGARWHLFCFPLNGFSLLMKKEIVCSN